MPTSSNSCRGGQCLNDVSTSGQIACSAVFGIDCLCLWLQTEEVKEAAKEIKEAAKATAKEAKKSEKAAAK